MLKVLLAMFLASAARTCRGFVARPQLVTQIARPVRLQAASLTSVEM